MRGYDNSKPVRADNYPDSLRESKVVLRKMKTPDSDYFKLTDKTPRTAFINYLDENNLAYSKAELKTIIEDSNSFIMGLKTYYNRPRPAQINPDIKPFKSLTANTPSYPSGHSFQAYLLARYLTKLHPTHFFSFYSIARRITNARTKAGLHYPSDNKKAFELAHSL